MVTGASTAELAIILIDARKGVLTQSKRHGFIASLLNIPHVLVAVNKMDLVDYDQATYEAIIADYTEFASKLSVQDMTFIPISALVGDNVAHKSETMDWYDGPTLLHHLENVNIGGSRNLVDFRFPVQMAIRPNQNFRGFAGQIASGSIAPGEDVVVLPSGQVTRIQSIISDEEQLSEAVAGDSVILTLEDELDVSRGDMIVRKKNLPAVANQLECIICWMDETPMNTDGAYIMQHTTRHVRAFISELNYRVDVDTLHREAAHTLNLNEIGRIKLTTTQPIFFDSYRHNRATGNFILIDPFTNNTVAAGMIRRRARELDEIVSQQPERQKSSNVVWEDTQISRQMREERNGHKAAVLWFTGLSGSGKSTVVHQLNRRLFAMGCQTAYLDGDNVRHGLNGDLGFSPSDRKENIRRVSEVARLAFEQGNLTLCTFISPYQVDRDFARSLLPEGRFIEVFVKCDIEVCKRRDPKGLYAKALSGEIPEFTGISSPYEEPANPEMIVETDIQSVDEIVNQIIEQLARLGLITL
jgi:bifunctional enzyme CysN/CysC